MKNLIRHTISRAKLIIYLVLVLVGSGIYVYRNTPSEQFPATELPIVVISSSYYQASSADISEAIIEPLAEKLELLEDLDRSEALAHPGSGVMFLIFDVDADLSEKLEDVRNAIEEVNLPKDSDISVTPLSFPREAIVLAVTNAENRKLYREEAKTIKRKLLEIEGVSGVEILGDRKNAIVVSVDPEEMNRTNIEPASIKNAITMQKAMLPVGAINNPGGTIAINLKKTISEVADFNNVVLFAGLGGRKLLLSEIAEIDLVDVDKSITRVNDQQGNIFTVHAEAGIDMRGLIAETKLVMDKLSEKMGLEVTVLEDKHYTVAKQLEGVLNTILSTLILIVIFGALLLGIVDGLLVGVTIPLSFVITILLLNLYGYTINFPVLFGVLFAAGMVVDSSIVIIEWGSNKIRKGESHTSAFYNAAVEMASPIIVSVLTTLAAFLPLFFMPGVFGKLLQPVPVTAATILGASLVVSFLFIPALGRYFHEVRQFITPPQSRLGQGFINYYAKLVRLIVSHFTSTVLVSCCLVVGLTASLLSFYFFGKPTQFMDEIDAQILQIEISSAEVVSTEEEMAILQQTKEKVAQLVGDEILNYRTGSGSSGGLFSGSATSIGSVFLYLKAWEERRPSRELVQDLEAYFVSEPEQNNKLEYRVITPDVALIKLDQRIDVNIYATRREELKMASAAFARFLRNEPSVDNFQTVGPPEILRYNLTPYFAELNFHRITPLNLAEYSMLYTEGYELGHHLLNGDEIPIVLRVDEADRTLTELKKMNLLSKSGASGFMIAGGRRGAGGTVPLLNLNEESFDKANLYVFFQDGKTSKNFRILAKEDQTPAFFASLAPWLDGDHSFDASFSFAGTEKEKSEMFTWFIKSFIVTLVLILFILMLLFNSIYQTLLILSSVVFSVAGVALGLTLLGRAPAVMMTGMGLIFLAGIVVNNNIILIDRYNKLLLENSRQGIKSASGVSRKLAALVIAVGDRFRPIVFTTLTTILGVLPAALAVSLNLFSFSVGVGDPGIVWYQDLAIAIVLGLSTATFVTLIGTPSLMALGIYLQNYLHITYAKIRSSLVK